MSPLTPPSHHILIAEDSPTQALLLENILQKRGYQVTAARNGQEAHEFLLGGLNPELVISDIQMPEMDGYQLCREIKTTPALQHLPVMLLTSLSAPEDIIRGLECGADNFVVKPYEAEFLMTCVRGIIANSELNPTNTDLQGIPVYFAGERYTINANRRQILTLLLSTYETAVKTNLNLIKAHEELKAAQAQLIEAEKLQSVARLAAGVAHEVRNPLAILEMGISLLASQKLDPDGAMILVEMTEAVARANHVVSSLMDLSPRESGMADGDVNEIVETALGSLQDGFSTARIEVTTDFADDLPRCRVDPGKIEQVFINLFSNSIQAMRGGGRLTVSTALRPLGEESSTFAAGDRSGGRIRDAKTVVVVEIRDTGSGIAGDDLPKIYEPFFSTKPTGEGMGLGLTVARKIVDLHHGTLSVRNAPDGGVVAVVGLNHS